MEHQRAIQNLAVESYLLGDMTPEERDAFEEHYFECSLCADDGRSASRFMEDAREILRESPEAKARPIAVPPLSDSGLPQAKPRKSVASGWFGWLQPSFAAPALAALLLVVGIQSIRIIPNLRHELEEVSAPHVLASVVLRPATRGEPVSLAVRSGSGALLVLDLAEPPASATPLQFVFESADGQEALRAFGSAPEPGQSVNLIIPRLDLAAGTYTLVAEHAAAAGARGQELGRFPLQLKTQ